MIVYLLRVNLDVGDEEPLNSPRFQLAASSISCLWNPDIKIVLLSHRGRPKKKDIRLSLKPIIRLLSRKLKKKIIFLDGFNFRELKQKIKNVPSGSVLALENLRFLKGEAENSVSLAQKLAGLGDIYINDDFASSHRKHASIAGLPRFLPSVAGFNLQDEIRNLNQILRSPSKPFVLIVGGVKIKDKIKALKNLLALADKILIGGGLANTFLKNQGIDIQNSVFDAQMVKTAKALTKTKVGREKIILPVDWQIEKKQIMDIGPKTIRQYCQAVLGAKTIVWAGPMGYIEKKRFQRGSAAVAQAIARANAFSIVAGGETASLIVKLKLQKKISFLSTGGGAALYFLSGQELPGLKSLKKNLFNKNVKKHCGYLS